MTGDVRTARVTVDEDGDVQIPESVAEVVEEHRETLELVAEGDDESARMAQNILDEANAERVS